MFICVGALFFASGDLKIDMPCIRCPEECENVARLSPLVASVKRARSLSDQVDVYKVSGQPTMFCPFLKILHAADAIAILSVK